MTLQWNQNKDAFCPAVCICLKALKENDYLVAYWSFLFNFSSMDNYEALKEKWLRIGSKMTIGKVKQQDFRTEKNTDPFNTVIVGLSLASANPFSTELKVRFNSPEIKFMKK